MIHAMTDLAIVLRTIGLVCSVAFVIRYSRMPWRSTREGRHLMSFSGTVAAFLAYATINNVAAAVDDYVPPGRVDGDYPGRLALAVILYGAVAFEMWRRNRLLTLARRQH